MDGIIIAIIIAFCVIPGLAMMNIGMWQLKKGSQTFGSIGKQRSDMKFFEVQKRFYSANPGLIESDFVQWYTDKKSEYSRIFGAYDPPRFSVWIVEKGRPNSFYQFRPGMTTVNEDSDLEEKSLEQLKTEVTQKFFAEFPGASLKDFQEWQDGVRKELVPDDYVPIVSPYEEEAAVWEGFLGWLDTEPEDDH